MNWRAPAGSFGRIGVGVLGCSRRLRRVPAALPVKLLAPQQLQRLTSHLARRLEATLADGGLQDATGKSVAAAIARYVDAGGKRIRPQLCWWTFDQCRGDGDAAPESAVLDAACAWEIFHAFLLIHDDIIDASDTRRGRPSLHRELAGLDHDSPVFGTNLGIVAGDLLFAASMRLWNDVARSLAPEAMARQTAAFDVFSRVALETGAGQAADITQAHAPLPDVTEDQVLAGYAAKTAAYTFEGPMLTGAILAGIGDDTRGRLSRFATALGQAYQLQNDLIDLAAPVAEGSDVTQGKRTLTLVRGRDLCGRAGGADAFTDDVRDVATLAGSDRLAAATRLRQRLFDSGAVESTRQCICDLLDTARAQCDGDGLPGTLRVGLNGILDALEASYFSDVECPSPQAASSHAGS